MATITTTEIRKRVMNLPKYSSPTWHSKVNKMSDRQVYAIYRNFVERGYFDEVREEPVQEPDIYHQMTIFEYMIEKGVQLDEEIRV